MHVWCVHMACYLFSGTPVVVTLEHSSCTRELEKQSLRRHQDALFFFMRRKTFPLFPEELVGIFRHPSFIGTPF